MGLHSASRLGLVAYLYQHRYHVAVFAGMSAEVPITLCSHQQGPDFNLPAWEAGEQDAQQNLPPSQNLRAPEIQLFIAEGTDMLRDAPVMLTDDTQNSAHAVGTYHSPTLSIFHPPS